MLVPHHPDTTIVLQNLGYDVPAPILSRYDWAGVTPFEAQRQTAALLSSNTRAYCLSEMGTGKSLSVLFAFDYLKKVGRVNKMMIIAPLSTLGVVWANEVFRWMPHLRTSIVHGTTRKLREEALAEDADIYIINHDGPKTFFVDGQRTRQLSLRQFIIDRTDIDVVVIDELAIFRNASTARWKAVNLFLRSRGPDCFIWGLTGGPTPKGPMDAWAQAKLITPHTVNLSALAFKHDTMVQVSQFQWVERKDATAKVYGLLQPSIRYTREECVDLPETTYSMRQVPFSSEQSKAYKEMVATFVATHPRGTVTAVNAAVQMGKLLQISTGFMYPKAGLPIPLDNKPRIDETLEIIEEAAGKVIIFVPFKHGLNIVRRGIEKHYSCEVVSGDTPQGKRTAIFNAFQHSTDPHVLIAHPKVAAHGLTLTSANTILWFSVLPDLEIYNQACARVARPGQTRKTHIIHLVSAPVEEKVARVLERRGNMQAALLDAFEQSRGSLLTKINGKG
jgi:SNF2 family DNA or RNA helicase